MEHYLRIWTRLNFVSQLVIGHLTYAEKCAPTEMSKAQALSSRFYLVGETLTTPGNTRQNEISVKRDTQTENCRRMRGKDINKFTGFLWLDDS